MKKQAIRLVFLVLVLIGAVPVLAQDGYQDPADLADPNGVFLDINGYSVYLITDGPEDGPPVLLLHGFLGSVIDWTNTIPALVEAGYRVIAFDRPPFGLSDKRTDLCYTATCMSELTAGLMDALDIQSAALVGHSAGGLVASDFALRYPERVEKLVLVAGAVGLDERDYGEQGSPDAFGDMFTRFGNVNPDSPLAQGLIRAIFNSSFAENLLSEATADDTQIDRELLEKRGRGLKVEGWEGGLLAFVRDASSPDSQVDLEQLTTVEIPTLLVWGEADRIVPISVGERLRDVFPNDTWISYADVGHMVMDENTAQFNADLVEFLTTQI